jgi:DNA-binding response OmpR family regulator
MIDTDPFKPTVLLVDDETENLNVLEGMLRKSGLAVAAFPRGDMAYAAACANPPEIVLMDVRMPRQDGYDLCRVFKRNPMLADIPVIFVSALDETRDKLAAFAAGGVDYVTKPFCEQEVLGRIGVQLRMQKMQRELKDYNRKLESAVEERTARLAATCRQLEIWLDAKEDWIRMLSHELRTPVTGVLGVADLLFEEPRAGSHLHALSSVYRDARERLMELIEDATLLADIRSRSSIEASVPIPLRGLLTRAIEHIQRRIHPHGVLLPDSLDDTLCVPGEELLLTRVFSGLIWTAFCCSSGDAPIRVEVTATAARVQIRLLASGASLPQQAIDTFFDIFGQRVLRRSAGTYGLAPALANRILTLCEGDVRIWNLEGSGVGIEVSLPQATQLDK